MNTLGMARPAHRRLTAAAAAAIALHALAAYGLFKTLSHSPHTHDAQPLSVRLVDTPSPPSSAPQAQAIAATQAPARRTPPKTSSRQPSAATAPPDTTARPDDTLDTLTGPANHPSAESQPDLPSAQPDSLSTGGQAPAAATSNTTAHTDDAANHSATPEVICPGYQTALATHTPSRQLLRAGQGGEVIVEFAVAMDGSIGEVDVISSTDPRLNHWATSGVRHKLHCEPQARPIRVRLPMRLRFD